MWCRCFMSVSALEMQRPDTSVVLKGRPQFKESFTAAHKLS